MADVKWVLASKFAELTGHTLDALNKKMTRGILPEGRVWRIGPDGRRYLNKEEFDKWVEGQLTT